MQSFWYLSVAEQKVILDSRGFIMGDKPNGNDADPDLSRGLRAHQPDVVAR
jgi:hypothetical protein